MIKSYVIGLGNIGMLYDLNRKNSNNILTHCHAIHSHPNFELIGACDPNPKARKSFKLF